MDDSDDEYIDNTEGPIVSRRRQSRRNGANSTAAASGLQGGYSWEDEYHRSWDVVQEDAGGTLSGVVANLKDSAKLVRKQHISDKPVRRGIIRNIVLIIDMTEAMADSDFRPSRMQAVLAQSVDFVNEFFVQNPISQLAIVTICDGLAELISPLDGNPEAHIEALQKLRTTEPLGVPSLQNALELARAVLLHVPNYNTKEVLLVYGALMSNDPGNITTTISHLVRDNIRVRVLGLAAQVAVCQKIAQSTNNGSPHAYSVALDEQHLKQVLNEVTTPLTVSEESGNRSSALVEMGFPSRSIENKPSLCACHAKLSKRGYKCPRCLSKVCSLPTACPVCRLTLILSTHLARPYHHLFPLPEFKESEKAENCIACRSKVGSASYMCKKCNAKFCLDCDLLCHETLHVCPGCESKFDKGN